MNRRTFLASSVGGTAAVASMKNVSSCAAIEVPSGLTKANISTPALVLDLDRFEGNVHKMAEHGRRTGRGIRPHAKTHKCPEIAKRQLAAGAIGICAATVSEAEALAAAGIRGILLTSPIVDPRKIARMVALCREPGAAMLSVGSAQQAELLSTAAAESNVVVDVLIDIDVGDRRTGSLPGEPALQLAKKIAASKHLKILGVQAYAGHASHTVGFEARQKTSQEAMSKAIETRKLLEAAGFNAKILSGGSTGTYNIDSEIAGVTELQVGSYVFMDVDYRRIGGQAGSSVYLDFEPSLTVLTTVVNATHTDRVTVDAGTKAIDTTTTHRPESKTTPGLIYSKAGDEFGAITAEPNVPLPVLGDRLEFIVPHCDPNVNLYDRIYACRADRVEAIWPVMARRENTSV